MMSHEVRVTSHEKLQPGTLSNEYVQIGYDLCVPFRTAQLAARMPGLVRVLEMGVVVMDSVDSGNPALKVFFSGRPLERFLEAQRLGAVKNQATATATERQIEGSAV